MQETQKTNLDNLIFDWVSENKKEGKKAKLSQNKIKTCWS